MLPLHAQTPMLLGSVFLLLKSELLALIPLAVAVIFGRNALLCIKLGIVVAQVPAYPHQNAFCRFCPRWRDSTNRAWHTGFGSMQVLDSVEKIPLVHRKRLPLLLRLCFYKEIKEKTEEQLPEIRGGQEGDSKTR